MKHLIGKPVKYKFRGGEVVESVLVAIDPEVGISIVREDNPERNVICLHGPKAKWATDHELFYQETFDYVVKCVENQTTITVDELVEIENRLHPNNNLGNDVADCAFI